MDDGITNTAPPKRLRPSSAARWAGQCAGSVKMEAESTLGDDPAHDQAKAEGNAAHWLAQQIFAGVTITVGTLAPNGIVIDDEMIEAVELYVDDVKAMLPDVPMHVEEYLPILRIHSENGGTPDNWKFHQVGDQGLLAIWDLKFGHGFVDAFENWQMIDYTAGLLDHPALAHVAPANLKIVFTVVQPRNYSPVGPIRRWETTYADLHPFFEQLKIGAVAAVSGTPWLRVGDMCENCKGRHHCPALHAAADRIADMVREAVPLELPPNAAGLELKLLEKASVILEARITGLRGQVDAMLKAGKNVPYWMRAAVQGKEIWTADAATIFATGDALGKDLRKAPAPITPNQARKAGLDAAIVAGFSDRAPSAMKLTPVDTQTMKRIFSK